MKMFSRERIMCLFRHFRLLDFARYIIRFSRRIIRRDYSKCITERFESRVALSAVRRAAAQRKVCVLDLQEGGCRV